MDFIKLFEIVTKFAWPVFACTACILFIPTDNAVSANLAELRARYLLELQLTFFISAIVSAGTLLPSKAQLWRYVACPLKKLFFPIVDLRSGIKQSRMRYRKVAFPVGAGEKVLYQCVDSNGGGPLAYYDSTGKRIFPELNIAHRALDDDWTLTPKWAKIDFQDLFNGKADSGVWAIVEL